LINSYAALKKYFGYSSFRTGQEEIIKSIIDGENVLAVLPTGAGKSLCYQIPALVSQSFAIVISPLIALMKDQVDSLNKIEPIAAFINSTLDFQATEKVLKTIESGQIKILYVSPEKLAGKGFSEQLKTLAPNYIFIDEAHCISEWGHNFRPSYRKIKDFIEFCEVENIAAFTATATQEVRDDIIEQLGLIEPKVFVKGFERPNLSLSSQRITNKKEKTLELLKPKNQPAIVYTATRKNCEDLAQYLTNNNLNAVYYHAGLKPELKRMIQDDFMTGKVKVICATNAFGMGIDKSDIRMVIHYNMPGSLENYYQEIGRAGRDGKESRIALLFDERDLQIQKYFIDSSQPARKQIETAYDLICDYGKIAVGMMNSKPISFDMAIQKLFGQKQISPSLVDSCIRILNESGYLEMKSELQNHHMVHFPLNPKKLHSFIQTFSNADHKDLLVLLAREYGGTIFKSPIRINLKRIAQILEESEIEITNYLLQLSRGGIIEYESPSSFPILNLLVPRISSAILRLDLERLRNLNKNLNYKLDRMIEYTETKECKMKFILNYFGQDTSHYKCGKCYNCTSGDSHSQESLEYLDELILQTLHECKTPIKKKNMLQILTGKTEMPSLRKFSSFGTCAHFKKKELEDALDQLFQTGLIIVKNDSFALSENGIQHFSQDENVEQPKVNYEEKLHIFNQLRQARKEASEKFGQPTHLVCSDEILKCIAKEKPQTHSALLSIEGFTQRMFNKIGEDFLNIIQENSLSETKRKDTSDLSRLSGQLIELINRKYSIEEITKILKLPESLLIFQLESVIKIMPEIDISGLVTSKEQKQIISIVDEGITEIKQIREALKNRMNYSKIKLVLAKKGIT
jgi:ATP-dependent DNA helicase RecQ